MHPRRIAILTTGALAKQPVLATCLHEFDELRPWSQRHRQGAQAVAGWGYKPSANKARRYAERLGMPYVAIEDGFLRSWGLNVQGYASHSLVVDHLGIYYDASRPSDLETMIGQDSFLPGEQQRAERAMARLRELRLSKYNHAPDLPLPASNNPRVLVVDQTRGDASITYGMANAKSFEAMLDYACDHHPHADILIKAHPDVVAGSKAGHLMQAGKRRRCHLLTEDINPWALFDAVEAVHVVTSQLGFEALIAGLPVTCHGLPFYAGWGLTDDRCACPRRAHRPSLTWVFAAAYLRYCRYANPYTGQTSDLEATLDLLEDQRRQIETAAGDWQAQGFSRWKRGFIGDFLGPRAKLHSTSTPRETPRANSPYTPQPSTTTGVTRRLVWGDQHGHNDDGACWRMEDGFLRSVGLGIDLIRPLSLVIDGAGIYYDPGRPSDLETMIERGDFSPRLLARARHVIQRLVALKMSKYNDSTTQHHETTLRPRLAALKASPEQRCLLVPGQVESDASIRTGTTQITTNAALLARVREANPDALIIYKPHPDVTSGVRLGQVVDDAIYDHCLPHADITALIEQADEIHTMTSLTGFEALLRGTRVTTYGVPFYAGWGLTLDQAPPPPRRSRRATLEELVAATLIVYPRYVDPTTRHLINVETAITLLDQRRQAHPRLRLWQRAYRLYRNTVEGRH
ncbi:MULTISPECIES: capsular polysaccharide biosynthesis protein [unclassified Halomonas]|uniref:capsular polysaccharide biosynthesis protein n=1 Tax=unclassified Halomonas TaxID=2609666 RepID=UPI001C959924|nr:MULTISPECIES: capsular polysaccharide biosynthesis protein [unclassified Halomonas]MBY5926536.1 capsular polysaccharide biosynthesis protein [Halomonas sp. DP4Y7-2]MBY6233751.1 capsular polysaccharide biosynthesis protein [Halomonas sp. DP4Y7-1]